MVARWVDVWEPGRLTHGRRGGKKERGSTEGREGSEAAMGNYTCFTVRRRGAVQQARAAALTNSTKGGRITKAAMQQAADDHVVRLPPTWCTVIRVHELYI